MGATKRPAYVWNANQPAGDMLGVVRPRHSAPSMHALQACATRNRLWVLHGLTGPPLPQPSARHRPRAHPRRCLPRWPPPAWRCAPTTSPTPTACWRTQRLCMRAGPPPRVRAALVGCLRRRPLRQLGCGWMAGADAGRRARACSPPTVALPCPALPPPLHRPLLQVHARLPLGLLQLLLARQAHAGGLLALPRHRCVARLPVGAHRRMWEAAGSQRRRWRQDKSVKCQGASMRAAFWPSYTHRLPPARHWQATPPTWRRRMGTGAQRAGGTAGL